jgi:hypothetical protein
MIPGGGNFLLRAEPPVAPLAVKCCTKAHISPISGWLLDLYTRKSCCSSSPTAKVKESHGQWGLNGLLWWPGHRKPEFHVSAAHRKRSHFLHSSRRGGGGGRGDWLVLWETFLQSVLESMGNIWWLVPNRSPGSKVKVWVIWLLGFKSHWGLPKGDHFFYGW